MNHDHDNDNPEQSASIRKTKHGYQLISDSWEAVEIPPGNPPNLPQDVEITLTFTTSDGRIIDLDNCIFIECLDDTPPDPCTQPALTLFGIPVVEGQDLLDPSTDSSTDDPSLHLGTMDPADMVFWPLDGDEPVDPE